jgi:hypothetical protein
MCQGNDGDIDRIDYGNGVSVLGYMGDSLEFI